MLSCASRCSSYVSALSFAGRCVCLFSRAVRATCYLSRLRQPLTSPTRHEANTIFIRSGVIGNLDIPPLTGNQDTGHWQRIENVDRPFRAQEVSIIYAF